LVRLEVLKRLCEAFGPPGFEEEVVSIVKEEYSGFADRYSRDGLGSIVLERAGDPEGPRVLLAGHADEIGFIVTGIDEKGYLHFRPLGGWAPVTLPGHRVLVRTKKGPLIGVVTMKPPHLLPPEERKKAPEIKDLYIDVGASSREEAREAGVRIGDPVAPVSEFREMLGGRRIVGKAFDDRLGVFLSMETLREVGGATPNRLFAAATVQEEVGLRGAETVADLVNPDVCIVLEVDIAGDVPGVTEREAPAKMGKGVSIVTWDRTMIPNQALKEFVVETAEEENIPYQLSAVSGGTDAHRIHLHYTGVPSIVLGVPTRHIHSHNSIASVSDVEAALRLVCAVVKKLDGRTVESFRYR